MLDLQPSGCLTENPGAGLRRHAMQTVFMWLVFAPLMLLQQASHHAENYTPLLRTTRSVWDE